MRLFVAIDLPDAIKRQIETLRGEIPGADWVKPDMYHLTLQFLGGSVPSDKLPEIVQALESVAAPPFTIILKGLGRFRGADWNGVVYADVVEQPALTRLRNSVTSAMSEIGLGPDEDDRAFHPHITLVYLEQDGADDAVEAFRAASADFESPAIHVNEFILYETMKTGNGDAYQPRATFKLPT